MADNLPPLPAGFVLDETPPDQNAEFLGYAPAGGAASPPPPPPGFEIEHGGRHLTFEEGQALLDAEDHQNSVAGNNGRVGAGLAGTLEGYPIVGPLLVGGAQRGAAALASAIDGEPYADNLKQAQDVTEEALQAHPYIRTAGNVAGGVAALAPVAASSLGGRALGVTGETLGGRSVAGMLSGAGIGAADAAVRSGGDLEATGRGAVAGGIFGGVAPGVGAAIGAGTRGVLNWVRSRGDSVGRNLASSLGADGLDASGAQARLTELGPEGMVADLGPNLRQDLGAVASMPGRGQAVARDALESRAAGAGQRIRSDADATLGQSGDIIADRNAYVQDRAHAASPLYQAAYAEPYQATPGIKNVIKTPAGKRALEQAQEWAANEQMPISADRLDVRGVDLVKRALDDQISVAQKAGRNNEVRMLTTMKNQIIKDAPQSYRDALDAFSGPSAVIDALDNGRSVFQRSVHPGEVTAEMKGMNPSERDAYLQGARAGLDEIMMNARNDGGAARAMFQKDANKFKLQALLGRDEAKRFLDAIERESTFADTHYTATGNSITAARGAAQQRWGTPSGDSGGLIRGALNLNFGDALASAGGKLNRVQNEALMAARRGAAADALTATGQDALDQVERLSFLQRLQGQNAAIASGVGTAAQIGVQTAPIAGRQLLERR